MVGYALAGWRGNDDGEWVHICNTFLLPGYRSDDIQGAVMDWCGDSARARNAWHLGLPSDTFRRGSGHPTYRAQFLNPGGYVVTRNFFLMRYAPLDHELEVSLPAHLEFRAVTPEHIRTILGSAQRSLSAITGDIRMQMETETAFDKNDLQPIYPSGVSFGTRKRIKLRVFRSTRSFKDNERYGLSAVGLIVLGVRRPWRKHGCGACLVARKFKTLRQPV